MLQLASNQILTLNTKAYLAALQAKIDIVHHAHPSVWAAIKLIDSKANPKWVSLFQQFPEALNW